MAGLPSVCVFGMVLAPAPAPKMNPGAVAVDHNVGPRDLELQRGRGGSFRHRDRDNGFEATIHPDGRVTFRNVTRAKRRTNYKPDDDGTVAGMIRGSYDPQPTANQASGIPLYEPGPYGEAPIIISVGTSIGGLADAATGFGRGRAQREFLRNTEELRGRMARSYKRRQLRRALGGLGVQLAAIWRDTKRPAAKRRALLFALWDEAAEHEPTGERSTVSLGAAGAPLARQQAASEPARDTSRAGERARRRIEAFIRQVAPRGSASAFSAAELQRLNARRHSRQRFDPYAAPTLPTGRP